MSANPHLQILANLVEEDDDGSRVRIYRLPIYMKERSPEDFRPKELLVGFYTHTSLLIDDDPMRLDITKLAIAREFCRGPSMSPTSGKADIKPHVWEDFVAKVGPQLKQAREKYDSLKSDPSMVERENAVVALDALFIVAYLRYIYSFDDTWGYDFEGVFERCRFNAQRFPVLHDLLMMENQVAMSLLLAVTNHLMCSSFNSSGNASSELYDMLERFVMAVYPFNHGAKLDVSHESLIKHLEGSHKNGCDTFEKCHHLLDCAYRAICGPPNFPVSERTEPCGTFPPCLKPRSVNRLAEQPARNRFRIPSATSLRRVGISVKVRGSTLTMNNIKFERQKHKYVLLVPKLIMNDYTASVFRNLALYEQIKNDGMCPKGDMRTYLYLMSSLLDSVQDVRLLVNNGVIVNELGSTEAVCRQWNSMCDGLYIPSSPPAYWSHLQDRISQIEKSKSNRWFAELEERNCSSLVIFVSFVVVSMAFIATVVSAVFQVMAYAAMF